MSQALSGLFQNKTTSTSSSTPTTPDYLQPLQGDITSQLQKRLMDPSAGVAPLRAGARNAVNDNFDGADQGLRDRLLAGGAGGSSGKFGLATAKTNLSRISSLSSLEPQFAGLTLNQGNNNMSLAQQFLRSGQGRSGTGTQVQDPGIGGALTSLASLMFLGGGGGGGGGSVGDISPESRPSPFALAGMGG